MKIRSNNAEAHRQSDSFAEDRLVFNSFRHPQRSRINASFVCNACTAKHMKRFELNLNRLHKLPRSFFEKVPLKTIKFYLKDHEIDRPNVPGDYLSSDVIISEKKAAYIYLWKCASCQSVRKTLDDRIVLLYSYSLFSSEEDYGDSCALNFLTSDAIFVICSFLFLVDHYDPERMHRLNEKSIPFPEILVRDSDFYSPSYVT
jgi:hypothetical protein